MPIFKEQIFTLVKSYDLLNHYLQPYHKEKRLLAGKLISNPFQLKQQETPSFNIYPSLPGNEWRYKDFATGDEGSCFDLIMKLFNLSFEETLNKINLDFNLNLNKLNIEEEILFSSFSIKKQNFSDSELSFWGKYGISNDILNKYNVISISEFSSKGKTGKFYTIKRKINKFIFAYYNDNWCKLYKPLDEKKYKFQYLGIKEKGYIFGWKQLPEKGDLLLITGGEKDVLTLSALGYCSITLNSETSNLSIEIANELKSRFRIIYVIYDNDITGIIQAKKLSDNYGFKVISLPEIKNNGKDISDYIASGGKPELIFNFSNSNLNSNNELLTENDKLVFNAVELMSMDNLEPKYLMAPILPKIGTAVLAGKPDTGKSQFARQLCIQTAFGIFDFLSFKIQPTHNSAIYVATEDNLEATKFLLNKQISGLNAKPKESLRFIFGDTMEQDEIILNLDCELTKSPADLVVMDSFGDIFKGNDGNNNIAMRNTVKVFDRIAKKHQCLILFVHHINKGAYRQSPGQEHIQGGAGLVQKVRLAIQLSEGDDNTRYFSVVKGNYSPKLYKQNSIILNFSENNFLFTDTGKMIQTDQIGLKSDSKENGPKYNEFERCARDIFHNNELSYGDFVKLYCKNSGKSEASAKRTHKKIIDLDLIEKVGKNYRLKVNSNELLFEDS